MYVANYELELCNFKFVINDTTWYIFK